MPHIHVELALTLQGYPPVHHPSALPSHQAFLQLVYPQYPSLSKSQKKRQKEMNSKAERQAAIATGETGYWWKADSPNPSDGADTLSMAAERYPEARSSCGSPLPEDLEAFHALTNDRPELGFSGALLTHKMELDDEGDWTAIQQISKLERLHLQHLPTLAQRTRNIRYQPSPTLLHFTLSLLTLTTASFADILKHVQTAPLLTAEEKAWETMYGWYEYGVTACAVFRGGEAGDRRTQQSGQGKKCSRKLWASLTTRYGRGISLGSHSDNLPIRRIGIMGLKGLMTGKIR
ncbi:hypothetical protein IAR50_006158 [Cryptococcus sp. DSM 104548]